MENKTVFKRGLALVLVFCAMCGGLLAKNTAPVSAQAQGHELANNPGTYLSIDVTLTSGIVYEDFDWTKPVALPQDAVLKSISLTFENMSTGNIAISLSPAPGLELNLNAGSSSTVPTDPSTHPLWYSGDCKTFSVAFTAQTNNGPVNNYLINISAQSPSAPAPAATGDDYYDRHYNFWNPVHAQLTAMDNNGTLTVDTSGHNLDHVQHFVFDALEGTNRTLIIHHEGETYRINGQNLGGIALGHNHLFYGNLDAYR